jgi:hypothetical protein
MRLALLLCFPLLLVAHDAPALTLTVGPGGTHASVQAAIDALDNQAGGHEIRILSGVFGPAEFNSRGWDQLDVSGGWDATFTQRSEARDATTLHGQGGSSALFVRLLNDERLRIHHLALSGARTGAYIIGERDAAIELFQCRIHGNGTTGATNPDAAGLDVYTRQGTLPQLGVGYVEVSDCLIEDNHTLQAMNPAAAGVQIIPEASGPPVYVWRTTIRANTVECATAGTNARGAGLRVTTSGGAAFLRGMRIEDNAAVDCVTDGSGASLFSEFVGRVELDGGVVRGNVGDAADDAVAQIAARGDGSVTLANLLVSQSATHGIRIQQQGDRCSRVTNVTSVDAFGNGLIVSTTTPGFASVFNTISSNPLIGSGTQTGANLSDGDARFRDAANGDYRLRFDSPARDAGNNDVPDGLGTSDALGFERVVNDIVDIGAIEYGAEVVFANGFETPPP